jgi:hypothetical protein
LSRLLDLYNHVNPDDEIYGDADDPAEIPAPRSGRSADLADVLADCDKNIGTLGCIRGFVASIRLVWRLSGYAVGKFDLAEQCHSRRSWICFNREWR